MKCDATTFLEHINGNITRYPFWKNIFIIPPKVLVYSLEFEAQE